MNPTNENLFQASTLGQCVEISMIERLRNQLKYTLNHCQDLQKAIDLLTEHPEYEEVHKILSRGR